MVTDDARVRARRAYERGRLIDACVAASATAALVVTAIAIHGPYTYIVGLGGLTVVFHIAVVWAHDDYLRGAWLGVGLGAVQLLAALFMVTVGMRLLPLWCDAVCFTIVLAGSAVAGSGYARRFAQESALRAGRAAVAMLVIGMATALVGCLPGSAGLLFGSVVGLAVGLGPGWLLARRYAH